MEARTSLKMLTLAGMMVMALPDLASAQTLQVFAFGDVGVIGQTNKPYTKTTVAGVKKGTSLSLNSGPWQASRLGFRGKVKLNDDFDIWYDAATTINLTQGLVGNSTTATQFFLFDRNAFVGFSSKEYGNLTFGRHPTVLAETVYVVDPLKANNGATNMNVRFGYLVAPGPLVYSNFGTNPGSNTNGVALDRQSTTAKYVLAKSGIVGMGMYGLGGQTGSVSKNMYAGAMVGYDSDGTPSHGPQDRLAEGAGTVFQLRASGQIFHDNGLVAGSLATTGPKIVSLTNYMVGGVLRLGPTFKVKASYSGLKIGDAAYGKLKSSLVAGGVTYSTGDLDLTAAVYHISRSVTGYSQNATKIYFVPEYYVSKTFWVYAIVDYEKFNANAATIPAGSTPIVTGIGPIDGGGAGANVLAPGAKNSIYGGLGISFYFNS